MHTKQVIASYPGLPRLTLTLTLPAFHTASDKSLGRPGYEAKLVTLFCIRSYNNEWMVVDYKLFRKGEEELSDGLLWVLEQLP